MKGEMAGGIRELYQHIHARLCTQACSSRSRLWKEQHALGQGSDQLQLDGTTGWSELRALLPVPKSEPTTIFIYRSQ